MTELEPGIWKYKADDGRTMTLDFRIYHLLNDPNSGVREALENLEAELAIQWQKDNVTANNALTD